jgi:hypothetical protein
MRRGVPALSADARRRRDRAIIAAYCLDAPVAEIGARFGVTARMVHKIAERHGLARPRGRPSLWPECPPERYDHFRYLRRHMSADAARASIEREMAL